MSLKKLLGLGFSNVSDEEIMGKIAEATKMHVEFIEITDTNGDKVRIHIPSIPFDEQLMYGIDNW